jgi:spore coat protein CotH
MTRAVAGGVCLGILALPFGLIAPSPASATAPKPTEERDQFFKAGTVVHLKIEIDKPATESLRREPRKYVKAVLKEGEMEYKDVGIHVKGAAGSWRGIDDKPGLTLNMDKFVDDQRYRGMDKFHLANSVQDPSYLSELICGELCRAAGVPAARVGHAVVTVNGRARGLYYVKEGYDSAFLKKHFGNSDGNFYDGGFLRDIDQPLDLISTKKDVADRADLKALVAAVREPNKEKRLQKIEKLLDLDKFISAMVLAAVMWDWDSYAFKCNNYRVYHDPKTDKITFIPSGMDQMFGDVNGPVIPDFGGMVARAIMETPEGRKRYIARANEIMKTVYKTDDLVKRLEELEKRIQPELAKVDAGAGRDYKNQVNRLREAIKQREKVVNEQLKKLTK